LALYLRAGQTPPASLVNSTTKDTTLGKDIKSVYTTPHWVTTDNMASTVVKDGAVKVSDLCTGSLASKCSAAGIS
jgi:D-xylose transport system substrate-binding protein